MEKKAPHRSIRTDRFKKPDFLLLALLAVAAILRFYNIGIQSPWLDELSTLQVSDPSIPFSETDTLVMTREAFPHLYFICLKFLSSIFGHSMVTLRMFSAVFGIASVYMVFLFLKETFGKPAGYIGAVVLTVNTFHIYHSQEGRCYALMVFFILMASYALVRYVKINSYGNAIFVGIAAGLIPNAHPIGFLNTAVIYTALLVFFLLRKEKKTVFFQLLVSGILTLAVSAPVYPIIARLSQWKSFWIPPASFANVKQAFLELSGSTAAVLYLYLISVLVFFVFYIRELVRTKDAETRQFRIVVLCLFFAWIALTAGFIIAKSFLGDVSLILNRYFIGTLGVFIATTAYCFSLVRNRIALMAAVAVFSGYSLYTLKERNYYTAVSKTQWDALSKAIIERNTGYHRLYSAYGFTSNILFKGTPNYRRMKEILFDDYLLAVRAGAIQKEPFWYFDGNFRPYSVTPVNQQFLDDNYVLVEKIEKYDCWARYYVPKGMTSDAGKTIGIYLEDFEPHVLDNEGHLLMFQDGTIATKPILLRQGAYELKLEASSLPEKTIGKENAHIVVRFGNQEIANTVLSEKANNKQHVFQFKVTDEAPRKLTITYDNDYAEDKLDRNVIIYSIQLNKVGN